MAGFFWMFKVLLSTLCFIVSKYTLWKVWHLISISKFFAFWSSVSKWIKQLFRNLSKNSTKYKKLWLKLKDSNWYRKKNYVNARYRNDLWKATSFGLWLEFTKMICNVLCPLYLVSQIVFSNFWICFSYMWKMAMQQKWLLCF